MEIKLLAAFPYAEYGWVTAPNAAGQSVTANTITTLTLDTEVRDDSLGGSISSNQVTIPSGTYYFEASHTFKRSAATNPPDALFRLYNVSDSAIISGDSGVDFVEAAVYSGKMSNLKGQFSIASTKIIRLEVAYSQDVTIGVNGTAAFTLSTAGAQQRTTLKLWKLE